MTRYNANKKIHHIYIYISSISKKLREQEPRAPYQKSISAEPI